MRRGSFNFSGQIMAERKPLIVSISGVSGSGKTTLCRKLVDSLDDTTLFELDRYEEIEGIWPQMEVWHAQNFDPKLANLTQPITDLRQLITRQPIQYPDGQGMVQPASLIIFDNPIGRAHPDFASLIDLCIVVDLPYEVALARRIQRIISGANKTTDPLTRLHSFIPFYLKFGRLMYISHDKLARLTADSIVDGMQPSDQLAEQVVRLIHSRTKSN